MILCRLLFHGLLMRVRNGGYTRIVLGYFKALISFAISVFFCGSENLVYAASAPVFINYSEAL